MSVQEHGGYDVHGKCWCDDCSAKRRASDSAYYQRNKDEIRAKQRESRRRNPEKIQEQQRKSRRRQQLESQEYRERRRRENQKFSDSRRDYLRDKGKGYYQRNKEYIRRQARAYQDRLKALPSDRKGEAWSPAEDVIAARTDITNIEKCFMLRRSYAAVATRTTQLKDGSIAPRLSPAERSNLSAYAAKKRWDRVGNHERAEFAASMAARRWLKEHQLRTLIGFSYLNGHVIVPALNTSRCVTCSKEFQHRRPRCRYCSNACRARASYERKVSAFPLIPCGWCGKRVRESAGRNRRWCSDACRMRNYRAHQRTAARQQ